MAPRMIVRRGRPSAKPVLNQAARGATSQALWGFHPAVGGNRGARAVLRMRCRWCGCRDAEANRRARSAMLSW